MILRCAIWCVILLICNKWCGFCWVSNNWGYWDSGCGNVWVGSMFCIGMVFVFFRCMLVGMIVGLGCQTGIEVEIIVDLCGDGAILLIFCYELGYQLYGVAHFLGFFKCEGYLLVVLDVVVEGWDRFVV